MKFAPRIDPRLVRAVAELDDPREPIAETRRRVGTLAESLDLPRPSYERIRQLVHDERLRTRRRGRSRGEILTELAFNTAPPEKLVAELLLGDGY